MKKMIFNWLYQFAIKIIALNIVCYRNQLTPDYLIRRGWIQKDGYYIEPGVKDRDLIAVKFENDYYRVYASSKLTFISLENSLQWFETYYLLAHGDNGRYQLCGV